MKRPSFSTLLIQLFALAALAALGVVLAYRAAPLAERAEIIVEFAKALLQLALIAVAGGIVSHLISDFVRNRTAAETSAGALDQVRSEFLHDFRASYYSVKQVRRKLRAAGLTAKFGTPPSSLTVSQVQLYQRAMRALNRAQMNFEQLQIVVDGLQGFSNENVAVVTSLRKMENYLRGLLKEYEEQSALSENCGEQLTFQSLSSLQDFTGGSEGSVFKVDFSGQFRRTWASLSRELLPLDSAVPSRSTVKRFGVP